MTAMRTYQDDLAIYELSAQVRDMLQIPFQLDVLGTKVATEDMICAIVEVLNRNSLLLSMFAVTHEGVELGDAVEAEANEISRYSSLPVTAVWSALRSTMTPVSTGGRPWRIAVVEDDAGACVCVVGLMHHLAVDGRSLSLFLDALGAELDDSVTPGPNGVDGLSTYRAFQERNQRRLADPVDSAQAVSFWRNHLAHLPADPFAVLRVGATQSERPTSGTGQCDLEIPTPRHYWEICRHLGISEFTLFHGIVLSALHAAGVPLDAPLVTATDLRDTLETLDAIGNYSNLSILRTQTKSPKNFAEFLSEIGRANMQVTSYGYQPLSAALNAAAAGNRRPLVVGPGIASVSLSYGRALPQSVTLTNGMRLDPHAPMPLKARHSVVFDLKPGALATKNADGSAVPSRSDFVIRYDAAQCSRSQIDSVRTYLMTILAWLSATEIADLKHRWPPISFSKKAMKRASEMLTTKAASDSDAVMTAEYRHARDVLAEAFGRVLDHPGPASANARFYDEGGYSLLALLVADIVSQETGRMVSVEDILTHQTPSAIARHWERLHTHELETIDEVRPIGSSHGPLYVFFPPATGHPGCYQELIELIDQGTVVCVRLRNNGNEPFDGTEVAAQTVRDIDTWLSDPRHTSVICVGWSAGGMIAAHAARQLLAGESARRVGLVLLDSYPEIATKHADLVNRHVDRDNQLEDALKSAYPIFESVSLWYRAEAAPTSSVDLNVLHIGSKDSVDAGFAPLSWQTVTNRKVVTSITERPHVSMMSGAGSRVIADHINAWGSTWAAL